MVESIPNDPQVQKVVYCPRFDATCSVLHDPFHGRLEITIWTKARLLEYASFERWLKEVLQGQETTVEGVARIAFDKVVEVLPESKVEVVVYAETQSHAPVSAYVSK